MFKPTAIYFEKDVEKYYLGQMLLEKYKDTPKIEIQSHNNIEEMRKKRKFRIFENEKKSYNRCAKNS